MKDIARTDYSKVQEFERADYHYTKFKESENWILWKVQGSGYWKPEWDKFELWKKVRVKNPDGSVVVKKLSDEAGGHYLWFFNNFENFKRSLKRFPEEVSQFAR